MSNTSIQSTNSTNNLGQTRKKPQNTRQNKPKTNFSEEVKKLNHGEGRQSSVTDYFSRSNKPAAYNNFQDTKPGANSVNAPADPPSKEEIKEGLFNAFATMANVGGKIIENAKNTAKDVARNFKQWIGNKLNYKINAINQGSEGNCSGLAAIAALGTMPDAKQRLQKMIKPTADGNGYKVTLPGRKPFIISKSEVASDSTKQRNRNSDLEAAILDRALHRVLGNPPWTMGSALSALTGKKHSYIKSGNIAKALKKGKLVLGAFMHGAHAKMVERIEGGYAYCRNPWYTNKLEKVPLSDAAYFETA